MLRKVVGKIINFIFQEAELDKRVEAIEARGVITRFMNKECKHDWEWDDYLSMSTPFTDLEAIRGKCAFITVKYCTPKDSENWILEEGIAELNKIVDELNEIIKKLEEEMNPPSN